MSAPDLDSWVEGVLHFGRHLPPDTDHPLEILVLRGHLLLEEQLKSIVQACFKKPDVFDLSRFPFMSLVRLAQALYADELPDWVWHQSKELNTIRNATAHELQDELLRPRIERFVAAFQRLDPSTFSFVEPSLPKQLAYCLAHLHHAVLKARHLR